MHLLDFKKKHMQSFLYLTRYFSRLGYVARASVLAKLMGANKIHFIGLDGFKSNSHYFENTKGSPSFNNEEKFDVILQKCPFKYPMKKEKIEKMLECTPKVFENPLIKELINEFWCT